MKSLSNFLNTRPRFYALLHILLSSFISLFIMCLLAPDLILKHNYSFIRFNDQELDYFGVFTMVSNFFHGKIQLWDNYGQMPLAYYYLNGGFTSFSTILTATLYILFSPFYRFPAESFHTLYSVVYFYNSNLIRTAGFYLLLSRFTKKKPILLFSTVLASTFMASSSYMGLNDSNSFSFYPHVLHFILRIFEKRQFKYVLLLFLVMVVAIGNYPLVGLGYFYLGVHLFLISTLVWFIITRRKKLFSLITKIRIIPNQKQFLQIFQVSFLSFLILLPLVYMLKENYKDYDFAGETSRFANLNIFDPRNYFSRTTYVSPQQQFFYHMLNFADNDWLESWVFIGITALFLSLAGIILSKDNRKYIFLGTAFLFWLINSPRNPQSMYSLSSVGHWIIALTDPFNFTLRTFHMTGVFLLPFVLLPLCTLGLESLSEIDLLPAKNKYLKLLLIEGLMIAITLNVYPQVSKNITSFSIGTSISLSSVTIPAQIAESAKTYLLLGMVITTIILLLSALKSQNYKLKAIILSSTLTILVILDGYGMNHYIHTWLSSVSIRAETLPTSKIPANINFQNPEILPFRQYFTLNPPSYFHGQSIEGLYYRHSNLGNYFSPGSNYFPKHVSYSRLFIDQALQQYLRKDNKLIYQADYGILNQDGLLLKLIDQNQDRSIILLDKNPHKDNIFLKELPPSFISTQSAPEQPTAIFSFDLKNIKPRLTKEFSYYDIKLPESFPKYLATGIFTQDISLIHLKIAGKELNPVQGAFTVPFSYDVQNIKTGYLTIALPADFSNPDTKGNLIYPQTYGEGIINIWKYTPDNLGITYRTDKDGWLVFHYPYDKRWQATVDGVKQEIYRANYSFMTIPITAGSHQILLEYWPDTYLRQSIALSMIILMVLTLILIWNELGEIA